MNSKGESKNTCSTREFESHFHAEIRFVSDPHTLIGRCFRDHAN